MEETFQEMRRPFWERNYDAKGQFLPNPFLEPIIKGTSSRSSANSSSMAP
jgi:hypothetical protein